MARATSITLTTSSRVISLPLTASIPSALVHWMWAPEMLACTRGMSQAAMRLASSTAWAIAATLASILTTAPRFMPVIGATPSPIGSTPPSSRNRATRHVTLDVPMSSPTSRSRSSLISSSSPLIPAVEAAQ